MRTKRTVEREEYYTAHQLAEQCVDFAHRHLSFDSFQYILEPSAGDGVFARLLPEEKRICIDVHPRSELVQKADFLKWHPPLLHGSILTIGNPPFGQRAALAVKFVERACDFSDAVAFILPRSFRKHTFLNRIDPMFHLAGQFDCDSFRTPEGEALSVKSVFQVWIRRSIPRETIQLPTSHDHFTLKHFHLSRTSPEALEAARRDFDFVIAQVGANFQPKSPDEVSAGSYWFIKARHQGVREVFGRLDFSFLEGTNTAFMSLSKKDIIRAYEEALDGE